MQYITLLRSFMTSPACVAVFLTGCATMEQSRPEAGAGGAATAGLVLWRFDGSLLARVPPGWSVRQTNPTESLAVWAVVADKTAPSRPNVLALTETRNYDGTFNLAMAEDSSYQDLDLTVRVKAVTGEEDQGGGPIWRCKDEDNYYICRFNPLEGNYRLYKVVDGKRRQLDSAIVESRAGRWYTLRVTMLGDQITCYLDGKKMLAATDGTFSGPGMVGLWTKADAVTSFDDLEVKSLRRE